MNDLGEHHSEGFLQKCFDDLLMRLKEKCAEFYGNSLVSLLVYGSVGRGTMRPDSDIDLLIVAEPLPKGRIPRVREFDAVERSMKPYLDEARKHGIYAPLSPVFKTPYEIRLGSPLLLDMVEDSRILFDRDGFISKELTRLRERLTRLGSKRVWKGNAWYWDLKPDYRIGDIFEI